MKKTTTILIALAFTFAAKSQELYHIVSSQCKSDSLHNESETDYYIIKRDGKYWQKHKATDTEQRSYSINISSNNEQDCYLLLIFGGVTCQLNYIKEEESKEEDKNEQ